MLNLINDIWELETIPSECEIARVVSIYKKGNPDLPENYRPISLLGVIYKLYAGILQDRLAAGIDKELNETQYGFRAARSTSQPLAILRRLLEYEEATTQDQKMYIMF